MARTYTLTVDNVGSPENIVVQSVCARVTIYEDNQAGTTDYKIRRPYSSTTPITRPAGAKTEFKAASFFNPGDIIGAIETVTGSVTFAQEEDDQ